MSDSDLGAFIRARREAMAPSDLGLPAGARRRTPGLRRTELAARVGVSVEYLTRLEQGRDRHPSSEVLGSLADALLLTPGERELLLHAAKGDGSLPCPGHEAPARSVRPMVRAMMGRLESTPAVVLNRIGDVLAFSTGYGRLMGASGLLDGDAPNILRYVFTDKRAPATYPEWERVADDHAARLRRLTSRGDEHGQQLATELAAVAGRELTDRLAAPPEPPSCSGEERVAHPEAGELRLAYETMELPDDGPQRVVVYLPVDDETSSLLDRLTGRQSGVLDAVGG